MQTNAEWALLKRKCFIENYIYSMFIGFTETLSSELNIQNICFHKSLNVIDIRIFS